MNEKSEDDIQRVILSINDVVVLFNSSYQTEHTSTTQLKYYRFLEYIAQVYDVVKIFRKK